MIALADVARSVVVRDEGESRGAAVRRRVEALGISEREFAAETGIDRKTLRRAMDADPTVRPTTYGAIETALDRIEDQVRARVSARPIGDPSEGMVELEFEESPGRRVVVKGPVRDLEALEQSLARLVTGMKMQDKDSDEFLARRRRPVIT